MIACIIQARMGSTRLPGKVLMDINGMPMVEWVINAAEQSDCNEVVVATTRNPEDKILVDKYDALPFHKRLANGKNDVLSRYYHVAKFIGAEHILRLTADCPLVSPDVINTVIRKHLAGHYDFTHTERAVGGYPNGLGAEIMRFDALEDAFYNAENDYDREHVTPFFYQNPDLFSIGFVPFDRYSVDVQADLDNVRRVLNALYS